MGDLDKVGIEKLSDTNYATWSIQVKAVLVGKKLWPAIRDPPPAVPAAELEAALADENFVYPVHPDSEAAQAVLCLCVGKQYLRWVSECGSARGAWQELRDHHTSKSISRQIALRNELRQASKAAGETTGQYVARVLEMRGALADAGDPVTDQDLVSAMMEGLPSEYFQLITTLKYRGTALTMRDLISALQQFEQDLRRSEVGKAEPNRQAARAFAANGSGGGNRPPYHGQQQGGGNRHKAGLRCHFCGKLGHFAAECHQRQEDERKGVGPRRGPAIAY